MRNLHGTPVWYELTTADPEAAKRFYDRIVGWAVSDPVPGDAIGYRQIAAPGGYAGGILPLTPEMRAGGARAGWRMYVGVDDVDGAVASAEAAGAAVTMSARDTPGVGRMALLRDPQGAPFYLMRGASDEASDAFSPDAMGRCSWNELAAPDHAAALAFYGGLFGWTSPGAMPMGEMGDYVFLALDGVPLGATMGSAGAPAAWSFYFRVADIDAAALAIVEAGGAVRHGPTEVPGGQRVLMATDSEGVAFGLVAR